MSKANMPKNILAFFILPLNMGILDYLGFVKPELLFTLIVRRDANKTYVLPNAPRGWEDALITNAKSEKYYAMTRSYSVPVDFVLDGAWILRKEFYVYGLKSLVQLKIEQLDKKTQTYTQIYLGDCDFSQITDTADVFTVNMMDAGIESKIKAFESTTFEIPVDVPEAVNVELTALRLNEYADFVFNIDTQVGQDYFPKINLVNNEIQSVDVSVQNVDYYEQTDPNFSTIDKWFYIARVSGIVRMSGLLKLFPIAGNDTVTLDASIYKSGSQTPLITLYHQTISNDMPEQSLSLDYDISVNIGDTLYFYFDSSRDNDDDTGFKVTYGQMHLEYYTISPPTTIKALRPYYVYQKLIELINGAVYPTRSYLLSETWKQLLITSGDAIRGFEGSVIKTSWNDFWQSINSETNAEFGDEQGVAVLENKNNAFKRTLPVLNVGEINDFSLELYEPFFFNTIKVGYDDQTYNQTNGRLEVNSTQNYRTTITRIQKELDLVSKYRADSFGIESNRINLVNKETKDADSDNDTFFIYVNNYTETSGLYRPAQSSSYQSVTGIQDGVYNVILSPKHMLYRHANYLASVLDKFEGERILFTSALKNTDVVTIDLNGQRVAEGENVVISGLGEKLFLPYLVTVKAKLPIDALSRIDSLPNGYVTFIYRDTEFRGYIIETSIDIAKNSSQELKLLLTPDNDLGQLVF